jgi:hypothetical protein
MFSDINTVLPPALSSAERRQVGKKNLTFPLRFSILSPFLLSLIFSHGDMVDALLGASLLIGSHVVLDG